MNTDGGARIPACSPNGWLQFVEVFNIVLEQEQIGLAGAGDTDEVRVVELDRSVDFLVIAQTHADRCFLLDQVLQITNLFKSLFGRFGFAGRQKLPISS